ncbi:MAG: MoxR family ATPase [Oscillibacter sp.]|nr:MoxR family ATPase [Oscillibacter sp.]
MLRNLGDEIPFDTVRAVTSAAELVDAQRQIAAVYVSDAVSDYIVALAEGTRRHPQLVMGASPRATRALYRAAKVWAAMEGRDFVTPDDVQTLAHPVLEHRLVLESGARFSGVTAGAILKEILERTEASPEAAAHEG